MEVSEEPSLIMRKNEEQYRIKTWPFDVSKTKLSAKFMGGRGKALLEVSKLPLQAQEFAKRKKIQELFLKGEFKLDQNNIPKDLLRLNTPYTLLKNAKANEITKSTSVVPRKDFKDYSSYSSQPTGLGRDFETEKVQTNGVNSDKCGEVDVENKNVPSVTTSVNLNRCLPKENVSKDYDRKNMGTKPLRKPDKSRKQYVIPVKTKPSDSNIDNQSNSNVDNGQGKVTVNDKDAWFAWENSVVVQGSLADEDLPDIATLGDNDDIHDVIVDQYVDALQYEQNNEHSKISNNKLTPNRVQQFSKLKSTTNADCVQLCPGTRPNLPKGDDRWGGSELNGMSSNMGWGEPEHENRNQYDDGSSMWSSGGSHYGGLGWSKAS